MKCLAQGHSTWFLRLKSLHAQLFWLKVDGQPTKLANRHLINKILFKLIATIDFIKNQTIHVHQCKKSHKYN